MAIRLSVAAICVILALALGAIRPGFNVAEATQQTPPAQVATQPQLGMQDMMTMHEQMMAEMKANTAKLDALVKDMNAAAGDARVSALVAVVNELARQHTSTHGRMAEMHQQMMGMMGGRMMNAR